MYAIVISPKDSEWFSGSSLTDWDLLDISYYFNLTFENGSQNHVTVVLTQFGML